ncbi:MAG: YggS family pyridoxal phosphate-dependent enzyme [Alphaproteobacteria bacterium]|nr:YggS family pyridoxal phosphate-dependent enzyme [Alphaproteobacteria bacterium]
MSDISDLKNNRDKILDRIAVCAQAREAGETVELVAVSKRQPDTRIEAMLAAGQRVFGENRVQEAQQHWSERRSAYPDLELRLIGPLQSNKTADAVALFDVIETLDREKLARAIKTEMDRQQRKLRLYIQVNTGEEDQKSGILPAELPGFLDFCRDECGLEIEGLMCIPPVDEPAGLHFALLAKLAREAGLSKLSMGMSGDFETAIGLGATSVRLGSVLFGARDA